MTVTLLEPDRDQLEIFIEALFRYVGPDGWISMRTFPDEGNRGSAATRITPISLASGLRFVVDAAEDEARRAANEFKAQVFCPPVATFNNDKRAGEDDLLAGPALAVECDQEPQRARTKLEQLLGPGTIVVRSGGQWTNGNGQVQDKLHLYWRLTRPAKGKDELGKLKQARELACDLVGGDPSNIPICHPIRWPGGWHRKSAPRLCEIAETNPDIEIDLNDAFAKLTAAAPAGTQRTTDNKGQLKGETLDWDKSFGQIITGEQFHPVLTPLSASFAA